MRRSGRALRQLATLLGPAALLVCAAAAAAQAPAEPPLADPAEALAPFLVQIERSRISADPQADRIASVLREALAALDKVEAPSRDALARLDETLLKDPRTTLTRAQAAERTRLRTHQGQAALARGDAYALAAAAVPKNHPDRLGYLQQAIDIFGALRVEYRDLAMGMLGYIGEARAQRAAANAEAAYAALKPLLNMPVDPRDPASQEIRRAGFLELLEIHLASDSRKALVEAAGLARGPTFKDEPLWLARIDYVVARAEAEEAQKASAMGSVPPEALQRIAKAAAILRRDAVAQVAPPFDRLALLAQLDGLAGESLLGRDELLAWADVLAATGRPGALEAYGRARAGGPLSVAQSIVYISLLTKKGDFPEVAGVCDDLLKRMEPAHAQRGSVLGWRAAALLKMLGAAGPQAPAPLRARAAGALRAVFEGTLDAALRRDALRQWVALEGGAGSLAGCVDAILAHPDLVAGDPYLGYSQAAGKWQKLFRRGAAGSEDAVAAAQARSIAQESASVEKAAAQAGQPGLAARAALLRAQVLSSALLHDTRAALDVLNSQWQALKAEPQTLEPAGWLRAQLMMDLGLVDAASKALAELPDSGSPNSPLALVRMADAMAARSAGLPPQALADVQREVLRFSDRAMSMAVSDPATFRTVAGRAARALLTAGAAADAQRILTNLLATPEVQKDARALLDTSLLLAEALERTGKPEEALKRLDGLAERYAGSAALALARARCLATLGRQEESVASARQARMLSSAGSEDWCRATLALAEGLSAQGHGAAAADILRVSEALYPVFGDTDLRKKLKRLRENLEKPNAQPGPKPAGARENPS